MGPKESIPNDCLPYSFAMGSAGGDAVPDTLSLDMLWFDNVGLDIP